jgi:NAD(P)-dependent dehydrogenase (short-subunit alcohol dehydrogenase family)
METENRVALITGAGRGVGRAVAIRLAHDGFDLSLAARNKDELEETRRLCGLTPQRALVAPVDLATIAGPGELFARTIGHFGRVDVLVNNAGVNPGGQVVNHEDEEIDYCIALNLRAPILLARRAAGWMMQNGGGGAIINVSTTLVKLNVPGRTIYTATKTALMDFTRRFFPEIAEKGIKITSVVLGLTDTGMIQGDSSEVDRNKMLKPEQIAGVIAQIISSPRNICPLEIELMCQFDPVSTKWRAGIAGQN